MNSNSEPGISFEFKAWAKDKKDLEHVMDAIQAALPGREDLDDPLEPGEWTVTVGTAKASVIIKHDRPMRDSTET